jgi:hypothetical protein
LRRVGVRQGAEDKEVKGQGVREKKEKETYLANKLM